MYLKRIFKKRKRRTKELENQFISKRGLNFDITDCDKTKQSTKVNGFTHGLRSGPAVKRPVTSVSLPGCSHFRPG